MEKKKKVMTVILSVFICLCLICIALVIRYLVLNFQSLSVYKSLLKDYMSSGFSNVSESLSKSIKSTRWNIFIQFLMLFTFLLFMCLNIYIIFKINQKSFYEHAMNMPSVNEIKQQYQERKISSKKEKLQKSKKNLIKS